MLQTHLSPTEELDTSPFGKKLLVGAIGASRLDQLEQTGRAQPSWRAAGCEVNEDDNRVLQSILQSLDCDG